MYEKIEIQNGIREQTAYTLIEMQFKFKSPIAQEFGSNRIGSGIDSLIEDPQRSAKEAGLTWQTQSVRSLRVDSGNATFDREHISHSLLMTDDSRQNLIALLQLAYSGELAAAYAYRGHWHSVRDKDERARIEQIEIEEWHHRQLVGEMLRGLGARPKRLREIRATVIGRTLGLLCHFAGWLAPMYGAGRLESRNIVEYEIAAMYARQCAHDDLIDCLLTMAEVEWEHEKYFRSRVLLHGLGKRLSLWPQPRPKEMIRKSFLQEVA